MSDLMKPGNNQDLTSDGICAGSRGARAATHRCTTRDDHRTAVRDLRNEDGPAYKRSHGPMQASHPVSTMISEGISGITGSPFAGDDPDAHGTFLLRQEAVRFRSTRSPTLPPGAARIVFDTSETATCLTVQSPRHDLEKVAGGVRGMYVSEGAGLFSPPPVTN